MHSYTAHYESARAIGWALALMLGTAFLLMSASTAEATTVSSSCDECIPHTETLVSDTTNTVVGDGTAVAVTPHVAWTASIPGATWIWKSSATLPNETVAFEKSFTVIGTVLSAQLDIASDNSYKVFIDNVEVAADANAVNFTLAEQDVHNLTASVTPGVHTLKIEVTNNGTFNATSNPAGLLYKFVVESKDCSSSCCAGDVKVDIDNGAYVTNVVITRSSTGGNDADGGTGGSGGQGGDGGDDAGDGGDGGSGSAGGAGGNAQSGHSWSHWWGHGGNSGGNGGNGGAGGNGADGGNGGDTGDGDDGADGGDGGAGGIIATGNAISRADIINTINKNFVRIGR